MIGYKDKSRDKASDRYRNRDRNRARDRNKVRHRDKDRDRDRDSLGIRNRVSTRGTQEPRRASFVRATHQQ